MYYDNRLESLRDIWGTQDVVLKSDSVVVRDRAYPIIDDVIILLDPHMYPERLRARLGLQQVNSIHLATEFAADIQCTFGKEWKKYPKILPEHEHEFLQYFDLIDLTSLYGKRVCDLGCGIGRWSYFLRSRCKDMVLVDFSEAIFVARENLRDAANAMFFMGDLKSLPFRDDFADLIICLGVLHHLPTHALTEVQRLRSYAPNLLIYLYYALDNRPVHFRAALRAATLLRRLVSKVSNATFRSVFTELATFCFYLPFVWLGNLCRHRDWSRHIPLAEAYSGKSLERIRQDVYDRFFTSIEQRFTRKQIEQSCQEFGRVVVSERLPYWHFLCCR